MFDLISIPSIESIQKNKLRHWGQKPINEDENIKKDTIIPNNEENQIFQDFFQNDNDNRENISDKVSNKMLFNITQDKSKPKTVE